MPDDQSDKRLKMIEIVLTLGGFLGIIVSLEHDLLVAPANTLFSVLIVLFLLSAFFAYSSISIPLREKAVQLSLTLISTTFSALLTIALSIPLPNATLGIAVLSVRYVGSLGAIIIYLAIVVGLGYALYYVMAKSVMFSLNKMTPVKSSKL